MALRIAMVPLIPAYRVIFGYLDRRIACKLEAQLARDVRVALGFLFTQHKGRIVPNQGVPFPPGFDYASVTVIAETLVFQFTRGRGEVAVKVAPTFAPSDLHDLLFLVRILGTPCETTTLYTFGNLQEVSLVLQSRILDLFKAFSTDNWRYFKIQLADFHQREQDISLKRFVEQGGKVLKMN